MQKARVGDTREVTRFEVVSPRPQPRSWPTNERRDIIGRRGLLDRIRGEFLEMKGLSLSAPEAARLLGVPQPVCLRILQSLIEEGSLRMTQDGRYTRPESAP
jgi:hypothetical protein